MLPCEITLDAIFELNSQNPSLLHDSLLRKYVHIYAAFILVLLRTNNLIGIFGEKIRMPEASFLDKTMISSYIFLLVVCVGTFFLTFIKQGVIHKSHGQFFFASFSPPSLPVLLYIVY